MGLLAKQSQGAAMLFLLSCLAFLCQEMVLANVDDLIKDGQDIDELLTIDGMEMKDDKLFFNGEEVQNIKEDPDGEDYGLSPDLDSGLSPPSRYGYKRYNEDILNNVEEVTPIKSIQEVKSIQEIKKMLPIKSIQEIKSIKEIESIEEIKDKLARNFIRSHGLKNLINDEGGYYTNDNQPVETDDLTQLRRQIIKDSKQCQLLKERVAKKQQEIAIMEGIEDEHCEAAQHELEEYRTLKEKIEAALNSKVASIEPIKSIEEIKSITSVESIQEVKSITPIESIQEVKHMYELTEEQAQLLKDIVNGNHYPARYGRRRRRRRNRF